MRSDGSSRGLSGVQQQRNHDIKQGMRQLDRACASLSTGVKRYGDQGAKNHDVYMGHRLRDEEVRTRVVLENISYGRNLLQVADNELGIVRRELMAAQDILYEASSSAARDVGGLEQRINEVGDMININLDHAKFGGNSIFNGGFQGSDIAIGRGATDTMRLEVPILGGGRVFRGTVAQAMSDVVNHPPATEPVVQNDVWSDQPYVNTHYSNDLAIAQTEIAQDRQKNLNLFQASVGFYPDGMSAGTGPGIPGGRVRISRNTIVAIIHQGCVGSPNTAMAMNVMLPSVVQDLKDGGENIMDGAAIVALAILPDPNRDFTNATAQEISYIITKRGFDGRLFFDNPLLKLDTSAERGRTQDVLQGALAQVAAAQQSIMVQMQQIELACSNLEAEVLSIQEAADSLLKIDEAEVIADVDQLRNRLFRAMVIGDVDNNRNKIAHMERMILGISA